MVVYPILEFSWYTKLYKLKKKALELFEMTAVPGCAVNWKEAFLKLLLVAVSIALMFSFSY